MILWPNGVCEVIKEWNKMDEIDHKRVERSGMGYGVCVCFRHVGEFMEED